MMDRNCSKLRDAHSTEKPLRWHGRPGHEAVPATHHGRDSHDSGHDHQYLYVSVVDDNHSRYSGPCTSPPSPALPPEGKGANISASVCNHSQLYSLPLGGKGWNWGRRAAFTLIEMLAAIVISLLFIGSVYGVYSAATTSVARTKDQQEVYQTARVLLDQLNRELCSAYQPASATLTTNEGLPLTTTATCSLSGTLVPDAITGNTESALTFITSAHHAPTSLTSGDLCQVTYEIAGDGSPGSPTGLYEIEDYRPGLEMSTSTETLKPRLLSPRVIALNCFYLASDGVTWANTWDATKQTTLPVAIRVELTVQARTPNAQPIVFATTANLLTATAPAATTTTAGTRGGGNATP